MERAEQLEPRMLLAALPYISEFMASNDGTLVDDYGRSSDWIEIANPTIEDVNLGGFYLTDDVNDLTKWQIPELEIPAGGYRVIFAPADDPVIEPTGLYANFALDAANGEYLALVAPDGETVISEYEPAFPHQLQDISYGMAVDYELTPLLLRGDEGRFMVPVSAALGDTWRERLFPDSGWAVGEGGFGFDTEVAPPQISGFTVRMVDVVGAITTVASAESLLQQPLPGGFSLQSDLTKDYVTVNLGDGNGAYPGDPLLPNGLQSTEEYVLKATANVFIPAGTWSVNVGSDDGFKLVIPGVTFTNRYNENTGGAATQNDMLAFAIPRGHGNTSASFTVPAGGLSTTLTLVFYENGGGDDVELTVASGTHSAQSEPPGVNSPFMLLSDAVLPGWSVKTTSSTPPPDFTPQIKTSLEGSMFNRNGSAYIRMPLRQVDNPADFDTLRLNIRYDDGFVAFLNGVEIARRNAPSSLSWNSTATADHPDAQSLVYETIDVVLPEGLLQEGAGTNVLAIHGLNQSSTDADFLIDAEIFGIHTLGQAPRYFTNPTPGDPNDESSLAEIVADTTFSHDRGFYDAPFLLTISTATLSEPDRPVAIRYTLDGSAPTATTGLVYSGPIPIETTSIVRAAAFKPGAIATNVDTQTYLFLADVINQPANPEGFPTAGIHWDYEMDPNVVNDPAYSAQMVEALKQIPSMSLVSSVENIFGPTGIYANPESTGVTWERPGSAELIYADGSHDGFQIDAGLRIYGGVNRATWFPKHTFRLLFKEEYGAGKLKYPLFEDTLYGETATDEFDTLILRGAFNNSWPFRPGAERERAQYVHDPFGYVTQLAMGQPAIHGKFIHLYVNGLYWGLYNIVERPSAPYGEAYFGGDAEDYDALNSSEPIDGTKDAWNTLQSIAAAGITNEAQYAQIQQYLDVDNLIDYMILNMYGGNWDWDDHNWYAMRKREEGAGYMFFSWDAERMLEGVYDDRTEVGQNDKPSFLFRQLRTYPEFRMRFADRVHKHFFNDGVLTPENAEQRYWDLANQINKAVIAESARWGDFSGEPPMTLANWLTEQNRLVTQYFPQRTGVVLNQFKTDGLYPSVAAPVFSKHGGVLDGLLTMSNGNAGGELWYTLDGSDPRLPGGARSPQALLYTSAIAIEGTRTVKARVLYNGQWSALNEAMFHDDLAALRITEIMYNPDAPDGGAYVADDYEYLELQNVGDTVLDIGGVAFTNGIVYTFPAATDLQPGQIAVLVKNAAAFQLRYPGVPIAGVFESGSLRDSGESITLTGPAGNLLDFEYKDGWYKSLVDGGGYSLVPVDPADTAALLGEQETWRPSASLRGSPGAADQGYAPGSIVINEVMTHTDQPVGDWIELHNTTSQSINIGGWYLSDDPENLQKFRIPDNTILPGGDYVVFTQYAHFDNPSHPGAMSRFSLSELGDDVLLTSNDGPVNLGGYREDADFGAAAREVTFGRHVKSTGGKDIVAMSAPTFRQPNAAPLVGPIVISEIMYHPAAGGHEFIELLNLTGSTLPLHDGLNAWSFSEGAEYTFPVGAALAPFGYGLVVGIEPALFRSIYEVPESVAIFGPWTTFTAGDNLRLARPGEPELDGTVPAITVDQINYKSTNSWPSSPDGTGPSLTRVSATAYGNDAINWVAGPPGGTPGMPFITPASPSGLIAAGMSGTSIHLSWTDESINEDGFQIERSTDGINFAPAGSVSAGAQEFLDGGLSSGVFYTYRVRAFNNAGVSAYSSTFTAATARTTTVNLVGITDVWAYNDQDRDLGKGWIAMDYSDPSAGWESGASLFYNESSALPAAKNTLLDLGPSGDRTPTFYFRIEFDLDVDPSLLSSLQLRTIVDDGCAVYLNGDPEPVYKAGLSGEWTHETYVPGLVVGEAAWAGPFPIDPVKLRHGRNVLAVEVHQTNNTSSDVVWGATLTAMLNVPNVTAQITPVMPDPWTAGPDAVHISFSEPVTGVDLTDLRLTRGGTVIPLTSAQTPTSADGGLTWMVANLGGMTAQAGDYRLSLLARGSDIAATGGQGILGADAVETFRVSPSFVQGTPGDDTFHIVVNGSNVEVFTTVPPGVSPAYILPIAGLTTLTIEGGYGDDVVVIAGTIPVPIVFHGGEGDDFLLIEADQPFSPAIDGPGHDTLTMTTSQQTLPAGGDTANLAINLGGGAALAFEGSHALASLAIGGSATASLPAGGAFVLRTNGLGISEDGVLDLADNTLIVDGSDYATIAQLVDDGRIFSGIQRPQRRLVVAAAANIESGQVAGQLLAENSVIVRYTWTADATLDGQVTTADFAALSKGYVAYQINKTNPLHLTTFTTGDFDEDGVVGTADFALLSKAYVQSQVERAQGGSGMAASVVREQIRTPRRVLKSHRKPVAGRLRRGR